jgi:hypothetical protein
MAIEQAWQVGVAPVVALQQVTVPQQGVIVQIGHKQRLVHRARLDAGGIGRGVDDGVHAPIDDGGCIEEHDQPQNHQHRSAYYPFAHRGANPVIQFGAVLRD